jgi:hypothetical protein
MSINVDFDWYRAFSKDGSPGYEHKGGKIHEIGRAHEPIKPLEIRDVLFRDFAQLDGSSRACVGFAHRWGFLKVQQFDRERAESLAEWRREIESMKWWIAMIERDTGMPFGRAASSIGATAGVFLQVGGAPSPSVVLRPTTLIDAMRLQMALFFAGGNQFSTCVQCGRSFAIGEARRSDAKFCSDTCRFRYHNKRRAGK